MDRMKAYRDASRAFLILFTLLSILSILSKCRCRRRYLELTHYPAVPPSHRHTVLSDSGGV